MQIIFGGKADILTGLVAADVRALRVTVLRAILGTDMTKHFGTMREGGGRGGGGSAVGHLL